MNDHVMLLYEGFTIVEMHNFLTAWHRPKLIFKMPDKKLFSDEVVRKVEPLYFTGNVAVMKKRNYSKYRDIFVEIITSTPSIGWMLMSSKSELSPARFGKRQAEELFVNVLKSNFIIDDISLVSLQSQI